MTNVTFNVAVTFPELDLISLHCLNIIGELISL